jgi:uncharacterized repeat protein (TIGR01451 family)
MLEVDRTDYVIYEYVNFVLTVVNDGDQTATGVQVYFPMPKGFVFDSQSTTTGDYQFWDGAWQSLTLAPGERATLNLRLFALVGNTPIRAFAEVLDAFQDDVDSTPNNANGITPQEDDEAVVNLGPIGDTDLELDLTTNAVNYQIYTNISYTCTVTNNGNNKASNISVNFPLPKGLVYTSSSVSQGQFDLFYETWVIGSLAVGETATLELVLFTLVGDQNIKAYAEIATASPNDVDSTPGNYNTNPEEDDSDTLEIGAVSKRSTNLAEAEIKQTPKLKIHQVFPNPVVNEFEVTVLSKIETEAQVQIYNDQGQIVIEQKAGLAKGVNRLKFNLATRPSGFYHLLILPEEGKVMNARVLKQGL